MSAKRVFFWQSVLQQANENLHFVFVSSYFKQESEEGISWNFPSCSCSVIHNPIDFDIFNYTEKQENDRLSILSIRPYTSLTYANDLTVQTIQELSHRSYFSSLRFTLVGDGELFDDTLAPLRNFSNVIIEKRFLQQHEVAVYHKRHGILLIPTRMDTQGVSRDEGMASGLVPVTTAVAAVPEFVDENCAMLAPPDDAKALAMCIEYLYKNPTEFKRRSVNAAKHVRKISGFEQTIAREIELITRK